MNSMKSMELVVSIQNRESLAVALDKGVGGVAARLPRNPDSQVLSELTDWRAAGRGEKRRIYRTWAWSGRRAGGIPPSPSKPPATSGSATLRGCGWLRLWDFPGWWWPGLSA